MGRYKLILPMFAIFMLWLIYVSSKPADTKIPNFIECMPSFYDLRHGDWFDNAWVRSPKNLKMLHETFKYFGYKRLLQKSVVSQKPFMLGQLYLDRDMYELLDSLLLSYRVPQFKEKYYKQFWQRRALEKNDSMVYVVLSDIKRSLTTEVTTQRKSVQLHNDTLFQLLNIEFGSDSITTPIALKHFNTLRSYGFHESAFNLLFERYAYYDVAWNTDSLRVLLKPTKTPVYPWFEDDTK